MSDLDLGRASEMVFQNKISFKESNHLSDEIFDNYSPQNLLNEKNNTPNIPHFAFTALLNSVTLPSIMTDERLISYQGKDFDQAFEGVLYVIGGKIEFRNRHVRDRFIKFSNKIMYENPIIHSIQDVFSLFEYGSFKNIIKFKSVCDMNAHTRILISILTFDAERKLSPVTLQNLFGFTPAESRLAVLLANGKSVIECADALGVRISTVREKLGNLFAKTGTSRQPELVSILSRLDLLG